MSFHNAPLCSNNAKSEFIDLLIFMFLGEKKQRFSLIFFLWFSSLCHYSLLNCDLYSYNFWYLYLFSFIIFCKPCLLTAKFKLPLCDYYVQSLGDLMDCYEHDTKLPLDYNYYYILSKFMLCLWSSKKMGV